MDAARALLKRLPGLLNAAGEDRLVTVSARVRAPIGWPRRTAIGARLRGQILGVLDCDADGHSRRTKAPAWPESWETARAIVQGARADHWTMLLLAAWLERHATTSRRTYANAMRQVLRALHVMTVSELLTLPTEAGLTWQRGYRRERSRTGSARMPRTVNATTAALNSFVAFLASLGLRKVPWSALPLLPITIGRHIDRDPEVLSRDELAAFWEHAAELPQRRFLALMLDSLHGLRRAEVARLRWGDLRARRRGAKAAPAVLYVLGKGSRPRMVQVHPALRAWLERARQGQLPTAYILADATGAAPTPEQISAWAKMVFRAIGKPEGYAHALRATWATLSLENPANKPLQVQSSGGWRRMETMTAHYFKRRAVPLIDPVAGAG